MGRLLIIPLALVGMLLAAMALSREGTEKPAEFRFINRGDIYTLDLNQMSYLQDFRLTYGIREGLYDVDPKTLRPGKAGAINHELSADKKVWTFTLRKECRWSNGDPVTARDYVFSWRRMLEEPGEYHTLFFYLKNGKAYKDSYARGEPIDVKTLGVEAVDDYTLRVTLDNRVPYLLELLAFPPFYPRNERSMVPFRMFVDTDVMDVFQRYVDAAKKLDKNGSADDVAKRLSAAVGLTGRTLDAAAVGRWVARGANFDTGKATQAEVLDALGVFAAMDPLAGLPATKVEALVRQDEPVPDVLGTFPPAEKLKRMLAGGFVRHTYQKTYTLPPDVVTNGAYVLRRWDFRRRLLLAKSETYWDRANVKTGSIEMIVAESPQSQLLTYETGQVDWLSDVAGEQAKELREQGRQDLKVAPAFGTAFLTILCTPNLPPSAGGGPNPLANVKVRQALALAMDKSFIVQNITRMDELPARTYLPPDGTLPDFTWQPGPYNKQRKQAYSVAEMQQRLREADGLSGDGAGLPHDVKRAQELLAEAGYPNGQGFPSLPILYNTDNPTRRDICQVLKNQWKQALNIDVQIQGVEGKIFSRRVSAERDYCIATVAWYGDYPDASTFTDKYLPDSSQNDSIWKNAAYAELCERAAREPDEKVRGDLLSQAEHMIDTELPVIPMYHYTNRALVRKGVQGCDPNPRNITIFKAVSVERK
jgi:ABC-type oligopeptide transport system substrate-binding subunit